MKRRIRLKEVILKERKELESPFTKTDSLFCWCCQSLPAAYLKNLDRMEMKKILLRLSRSLLTLTPIK